MSIEEYTKDDLYRLETHDQFVQDQQPYLPTPIPTPEEPWSYERLLGQYLDLVRCYEEAIHYDRSLEVGDGVPQLPRYITHAPIEEEGTVH